MAKSTRATNKKRNRAKLRATVFGPAYDARTSRLSAKLQELADQPKATQKETAGMEVDNGSSEEVAAAPEATKTPTAMEIDDREGDDKNGPRKSGRRPSRIEKKKTKRKARSSNVFRSEMARRKRMTEKKRQK